MNVIIYQGHAFAHTNIASYLPLLFAQSIAYRVQLIYVDSCTIVKCTTRVRD